MLFLIIVILLLSLLLTTSVIGNVLLWKAGERQLVINDVYINWISEWRAQVIKTYTHMKMLDDKEMFSRDDEVGILWENVVGLIQDLNDKTEEGLEEDEEKK